ncbi:hypothetical protein HDV01_003607, partial [Terramyces sp. JEL0728]
DTFPILVREEKGFVSWEVDPLIIQSEDLENQLNNPREQRRIIKAKAMESVRKEVIQNVIDGEAYFKSRVNSNSTGSFADSLTESVTSSSASSVIKLPVFNLVKQPQNVLKYRLLQGSMVLFAAVGLPLIAVFITRDTRI